MQNIILFERLKDLLIEKNITVEILAIEIKVDKSSVYKWLRNIEKPTLDNLISIADYFMCSLDYLLGRNFEYKYCNFKKCPTFNLQLMDFIKSKNITEYRICKDTKISRANFYSWKKGKHTPMPESIIRLTDYFDCSIDYLIGREN